VRFLYPFSDYIANLFYNTVRNIPIPPQCIPSDRQRVCNRILMFYRSDFQMLNGQQAVTYTHLTLTTILLE
ncbi:hypothetical protein, partial [Salmonella enterica]|uniref:hypothetical protein n=1 Tax=Salmonella enterica TaxID=28901 RepID=UPI0034E93D92